MIVVVMGVAGAGKSILGAGLAIVAELQLPM